MAPLADEDRILAMLEKINDKLGHLQTKIAVIEDQNSGQFRELKLLKTAVAGLRLRCDKRHAELDEDRHDKHGKLGERLQRIETILWLIGSTISLLGLILGGGVIVRIMGS